MRTSNPGLTVPVLSTMLLLLAGCGGNNPPATEAQAGFAAPPPSSMEQTGGNAKASGSTSFWPGVNGDACTASAYNCKLRVEGGNRVETNVAGDDAWGVDVGAILRDGNGDVLGVSTLATASFNYGQLRTIAGTQHAFASSTSNLSAAWFPVSAIGGATSFLTKVGHVSAKGAGLAKMACYAIRDSHDATIEMKKVVYDSTAVHERAGDYLSLVRANGRRSANLAFNVPGFAMGGPAVDHFPAGAKFQRLSVPTTSGAPSITIPLWVQDSTGRYRTQSGSMTFIYGYLIGDNNTPRNGWMPLDALQVSSGCP